MHKTAPPGRPLPHVAREDVPILDVVLGKFMTSIVKRVIVNLGTLKDSICKL